MLFFSLFSFSFSTVQTQSKCSLRPIPLLLQLNLSVLVRHHRLPLHIRNRQHCPHSMQCLLISHCRSQTRQLARTHMKSWTAHHRPRVVVPRPPPIMFPLLVQQPRPHRPVLHPRMQRQRGWMHCTAILRWFAKRFNDLKVFTPRFMRSTICSNWLAVRMASWSLSASGIMLFALKVRCWSLTHCLQLQMKVNKQTKLNELIILIALHSIDSIYFHCWRNSVHCSMGSEQMFCLGHSFVRSHWLDGGLLVCSLVWLLLGDVDYDGYQVDNNG